MKKVGDLVKVEWNSFIWEIESFQIIKGRFRAYLIHKFPFYKKGKYKDDPRIGCVLCREWADKLMLL